jgi:hypothetical protein
MCLGATTVPLSVNPLCSMFGRFGLKRLPVSGLMADRIGSSMRGVGSKRVTSESSTYGQIGIGDDALEDRDHLERALEANAFVGDGHGVSVG